MTIRSWTRRHPEWWMLFGCAIAGASLALLVVTSGVASPASMTVPAGIVMPRGMTMSGALTTAGRSMAMGAGATVAMFWLMVVLMMVPLTIGSVRLAAARSLWRRRQRAIAGYLSGFLAVWAIAAGVLMVGLALIGRLGASSPTAAAFVLALAALWQLTPAKQRALNGHHRSRPLAPSGLAATRDCLRFGSSNGYQCILSCGPMMAAMALDMNALALIPVVGLIAACERYRYRPPRRSSAVALGVVSLALFVF